MPFDWGQLLMGLGKGVQQIPGAFNEAVDIRRQAGRQSLADMLAQMQFQREGAYQQSMLGLNEKRYNEDVRQFDKTMDQQMLLRALQQEAGSVEGERQRTWEEHMAALQHGYDVSKMERDYALRKDIESMLSGLGKYQKAGTQFDPTDVINLFGKQQNRFSGVMTTPAEQYG